jgi:predicted metalloprotease with PDZ domain
MEIIDLYEYFKKHPGYNKLIGTLYLYYLGKSLQSFGNQLKQRLLLFSLLIFFLFPLQSAFSQSENPTISYLISIPEPSTHIYNVQLQCSQWKQDTIQLKMPQWMPGYYQKMNYAKSLKNMHAQDIKGNSLPIKKKNDNTWLISEIKDKTFLVNYSIQTERQFVANSYVDSTHAYIIPENTFLYEEKSINTPVSVRLEFGKKWKRVATGLEPITGKEYEFTASDFDILFDCPILIGDLEELTSFNLKGINHRFIGYNIGRFDRDLFMTNLKKIIESSIDIIGDIPYKQYTFIGIGPGRGGIEHLNNATISFDGNQLTSPEAINRMMNFIAHEYFHHYNVKRIRPFELGPFDYDNGNRTNLLWVSEGLTVYYEYLIVKRAGLSDFSTFLANFEKKLNAVEDNPGRHHQSLQQASYRTWSDGPFGTQGSEPEKSISYYDKGPLIGLFLDFEIRNATQNKRSLDDVMRMLYKKYYREKQRGFTEAEFQQSCEQVAGIPLTELFEYVYTTKELNYQKYLAYAGLIIDSQTSNSLDKAKRKSKISRMKNPSSMQLAILNSWLGE